LDKYKATLEVILQSYTVENKLADGQVVWVANDESISRGLLAFKSSLAEQEFDSLKSIIRSREAKSLNIDVSDIIIKYQTRFIAKRLKAGSEKYQNIIFSGSFTRQSSYADEAMAYYVDLLYSGKASQVISKISAILGEDFEYDSLRLSQLLSGVTGLEGGSIIDAHGILTLYSQAHKVAFEHPEYAGTIKFEFYSNKVFEMFSNPHYGFISLLQSASEAMPRNVRLDMNQFDASMRNDIEAIVEQCNGAGEGPVDSLYADTIAELVREAPKPPSELLSSVPEFSVSSLTVKERHPGHTRPEQLTDQYVQVAEFKRVPNIRRLQAMINSGRIDLLQESTLQRFVEYLSSLRVEEDVRVKDTYKLFNILFNLLSHPKKINEQKAIEVKGLCKDFLALREICSKVYELTQSLEPSPSRNREGGANSMAAGGAGSSAGIAAMAFAGERVATGPVKQSIEAVRVMGVLNCLIFHISDKSISNFTNRSSIHFNGQDIKVPEGVSKIFNTAMARMPAAAKLTAINAVLAEKGTKSEIYTELQRIVHGPLPGTEGGPVIASPARPKERDPTPEP
jgi:hypothetical protein